ncbi:class C sortase [Bifidobacterium pseudolongum]|uniref:class C sortase n=1 Tax=Bifidobacterium pseudolongum TaxID=1694 RepID=UPI00101ECDC7|nr:class C sortase [Bifidobacterium pseudolongum]
MRRDRKAKAGQHQTQPWRPLTFEQATDITDVVRLRTSLRRRMIAMRVFTIVLVIAAVVVGATPFVLQWNTSRRLASQTRLVNRNVLNWPYPQAENELKAAHDYNQRLAASGQPILGEAVDPFANAGGSSAASGTGDSAASEDTEYQSLLDTGDGVMGSVNIPKISVELPIYHGTSEEALADGAGHLYGTSLPVGGFNTHAVITGHRGMVSAPMFTRLDEMHEGDYFYIDVMGEKLGYKVDDITVIDPDDTSTLRVVPGEDRVTLMTCTPYGVNTQRLLVSGHRVSIPYPAPNPTDVHDARTIAFIAAIATFLLGLLVWLPLARRCKRMMRMRHARA